MFGIDENLIEIPIFLVSLLAQASYLHQKSYGDFPLTDSRFDDFIEIFFVPCEDVSMSEEKVIVFVLAHWRYKLNNRIAQIFTYKLTILNYL